MTVPKKPLSKTESAIQLGNILKYAGGRGGGRAKLRKIGEKATKSSSPIKEVKMPKKSLKNQKVNKAAKVSVDKIAQEHAVNTVVNKLNARTPIKVPKAQALNERLINGRKKKDKK